MGFLFYDIFIVMKKIVKLTESDLVRIVQRVVQEGKTDKGVKEKDSDVKIERFQDTIKNFIKSHDCKVKQVGDDFEIHSDGEHVGQIMFRKDGITVKKQGSKFGKEFDFNELGKVKSEIKKLTESDLTRIVKRVVKENEENSFDFYMEELGEFVNKLGWEGLDVEGEEMEYFVDEIYQIVHNAKQDGNLSKDEISQIEGFAMNIVSRLD